MSFWDPKPSDQTDPFFRFGRYIRGYTQPYHSTIKKVVNAALPSLASAAAYAITGNFPLSSAPYFALKEALKEDPPIRSKKYVPQAYHSKAPIQIHHRSSITRRYNRRFKRYYGFQRKFTKRRSRRSYYNKRKRTNQYNTSFKHGYYLRRYKRW